MPPFPKEPHLFAFKREGRTAYVVRACSPNEARAHVEAFERIELVRMTPTAAFVAAEHGIQLLNAKPEYANAELEAENDLFTSEAGSPRPAEERIDGEEPSP